LGGEQAVVIDIDPVAFALGPFTVRWYGVLVAVAVGTLLLVFSREAKRLDISQDFIYNLFLWGIIGGLVASRLVHVIDRLATHPGEPIDLLDFAGLGLYGAILGAVLAVWVYTRVAGIVWSDMAVVGDAVAVGGPLAQAIGRLGCFINGCCHGGPTSLPWGVVYTHPDSFCGLKGVSIHPAQVYFLLWNLVVFGVIWKLRKQPHPAGSLFLLYLCLYATGDFALRFFRVNEPFLLGLQQGQVISLAIVAVALPILIVKIRRASRTEQSPGA
jgi:phosphatidylglycerol:prolipoprotein diacylglycerol transferase